MWQWGCFIHKSKWVEERSLPGAIHWGLMYQLQQKKIFTVTKLNQMHTLEFKIPARDTGCSVYSVIKVIQDGWIFKKMKYKDSTFA